MQQGKDTGFDLWVLPTSGDRKPIPFLKTPFNEGLGKFSPDGRFIVYQSNESGRYEVYVQTFPNPTGKWQVSTAGGIDPRWASSGKEIFYRAPDQKLMAVDVQTGENFQAGIPRALFPARVPSGAFRNRYVVTPDGQRFLFVATLGREAMTPTTVVLNWFAELGR
jgi:Tol biopolymer transport system component